MGLVTELVLLHSSVSAKWITGHISFKSITNAFASVSTWNSGEIGKKKAHVSAGKSAIKQRFFIVEE